MAQRWNWVQQLGTTSLLVYWVHNELVYGHGLGWMKENLNVPQTVLAVGIILLMVGMSYAKTTWPQWRRTFAVMFTPPEPQRFSGD